MINDHYNSKNNVKTGICQGLSVLSILFLIYISNVFEQVEKKLSEIVSLLFIDDLGFIASKTLVKEIGKA